MNYVTITSANTPFVKGDRVVADWDGDLYLATVTAVRSGKYYVLFDDGDKNSYPVRSKKIMGPAVKRKSTKPILRSQLYKFLLQDKSKTTKPKKKAVVPDVINKDEVKTVTVPSREKKIPIREGSYIGAIVNLYRRDVKMVVCFERPLRGRGGGKWFYEGIDVKDLHRGGTPKSTWSAKRRNRSDLMKDVVDSVTPSELKTAKEIWRAWDKVRAGNYESRDDKRREALDEVKKTASLKIGAIIYYQYSNAYEKEVVTDINHKTGKIAIWRKSDMYGKKRRFLPATGIRDVIWEGKGWFDPHDPNYAKYNVHFPEGAGSKFSRADLWRMQTFGY
jgi:hypothetical protein